MAATLTPLDSAANASGVQFELKMAALLALRAERLPGTFQVFRNVAVALPFDDVVVRLSEGSSSSLVFMQLKHGDSSGKKVGLQAFAPKSNGNKTASNLSKFLKIYGKWHENLSKEEVSEDEIFLRQTSLNENSFIPYTQKVVKMMEKDITGLEKKELKFPRNLTETEQKGEKGDFNLRKYFHCFEKIYKIYRKREEELTDDEKFLRETPLERMSFVIFTNKVVNIMKQNTKESETKQDYKFEEFLKTTKGTCSFQFDQSTEVVWNLQRGDAREKLYREQFLPRLHVFHEQAHVSKLDDLILHEIQKVMKKALSHHMAKQVLCNIMKEIKMWAKTNSGECLGSASGLLERAVAIELQRQAWGMTSRLQFTAEDCKPLQEVLRMVLEGQTSRRLQMSVEGVPAGVRAAKLLQVVQANGSDKNLRSKWTYLNDLTLEAFDHSILQAVCKTCDVIVLDNDLPGNNLILEELVNEGKTKCIVHFMNCNSVVLNHEHYKDSWTLSQLTDGCRDRFIERFINFQGKLVKLNELEGIWRKMREEVDGRALSALARKQPKFGKNVIASNDEMLPRRLSHYHKVSSRVLTDRSALRGARLALQGFPKALLRESALRLGFLNSPYDEDEEKNIRENPRWNVLNYKEETCPNVTKEFLQQLVHNKAVRVIHWVEYICGNSADDVCMVWKESFGEYDTMRDFVEPISEEYCSRENPLCVHQSDESFIEFKKVLLVGEAGDGKTCFLERLASVIKSNDPLQWVIVVRILDHRELLREFSRVKELTVDHVVELLATAAGADRGAARRCLEASLRQTGALTLLVDGVDEVAPGYEQLTLRLLALLDHTPVRRVWVSTRPEVEPSLRDALRSPPLALRPLNTEEQQQFMQSSFAMPCLRHDALKHFTEWGDEVLGNPLHLRMMLNVANTNPEFFTHTLLMFDLYSEFVSLKYDEYERKYSRIPKKQHDFQEKHEKCAIVYLFADQDTTDELPLREFAEYVRNDHSLSHAEEKTGIVWVKRNKLKFAHQTYAEFFAAKWLFRNANSCSGVRKFVMEMMRGKFRKTRLLSFLREQLSKQWPLHAATWLSDMKEVERVMQRGFRTQQWDERDSLLHWTFGEYVNWAFKDSIQLFPEEIAAPDAWLVVAFKAAVESGCPLVAGEVLRRCDLLPSTLKLAMRAAVMNGDDGHREVVRLLLAEGVTDDANSPDTLLHLAAERGSPLLVDLLLTHSRNVNARGSGARTPLHMAMGVYPTSHKHEAAQRLIQEQSVDIEVESSEGFTPLSFASLADCVCCADSLLQRGAKVDGGTRIALCAAAGANHTNSMRFLMRKGAAVNAVDQSGYTPLHYAVFSGRVEAAWLLILEGADIHMKNDNGDTALAIALRRGEKEIAKALEHHANSNAVFDKEEQLAHLQLMIDLKAAAQRGSQEEVNEILQRSTFSPSELKGALLAAAKGESRGHTEVTNILLQLGAKDAQEGVGITSLHYAALGGNLRTLELLLGHYQDFNVRDFNRQTPLHRAIGWKASVHRHEATQFLLGQKSVDVEAEDEEGKTPLCFASRADCVFCAASLLQRGAKVDGGAVPPLLTAAMKNNTNIVRLLLENGAQVNRAHRYGRTALHIAASLGQKESVQLLLLGGADVSIRTCRGNTALDVAIREGRMEVANILKEHAK